MILSRKRARATTKMRIIVFSLMMLALTLFVTLRKTAFAWRNWTKKCKVFPNAENAAAGDMNYEEENNEYWLDCQPGERRGHSLNIITGGLSLPKTSTSNETVIREGRWVILFGGRSNDIQKLHEPKTYEISEDQGVLYIDNYENKKLESSYKTGDSNVNIGLYYNDIWAYPLDCLERSGDTACEEENWIQLHKGAPLGGCEMVEGVEICPFPTERYEHTAQIVMKDGKETLVIYGGFSTFCEDYCNDMWQYNFDVEFNRDLPWNPKTNNGPWQKIESYDEIADHPGKRWRLGSASFDTSLYVFGGYRLWHGFRQNNTIHNKWENKVIECEPENWDVCTAEHYGGYLDDLWRFSYADGWTKFEPLSEEVPDTHKRYEYDYRDAMMNITHWPDGRAGHSLTLVKDVTIKNCAVASDCTYGAGECVVEGKTCGCILGRCIRSCDPLKGKEDCAILGDNYKCNDNHRCYEDIPCELPGEDGKPYPNPQCSLYLFGGYRSEFPYPTTFSAGAGDRGQSEVGVGGTPYPSLPYYLNDLWKYNMTSGLWEEIKPVSETVPAPRQEHVMVQSGDILILFAGYAENFHYDDVWYYNLTSNRWLQKETHVHALYVDSCCTADNCTINGTHYYDDEKGYVFSEVTRGTTLDKKFGRTNTSIFIKQERNRAPGWDGCRDRIDKLPLPFPQRLLWESPRQISMHKALYSPHYDILLTYGGHGFKGPVMEARDKTEETTTNSEFWQFNVNKCVSDCSDHGYCHHGFCICDNGYYGIDCSNSSCPGDYCYYDEHSNQQVCKFCCSGPFKWNNSGYDEYIPHQRKVSCDSNHEGEEHGICNGRSVCQCTPPFIGEDCSIRDCPYNEDTESPFFNKKCSGNGWCSIEYPVSRCICNSMFSGDDCSGKLCLNNCSWPNGDCVDGKCICRDANNPYNRFQLLEGKWWRGTYGGDDCSYGMCFIGYILFVFLAYIRMHVN